jgi:hypothetical protein
MKYIVRPGDSLSRIAAQHGLPWTRIWDDANNKDLKEKRKNPNVLFAGDELFIPELEQTPLSLQTGKKYELKYAGGTAKIRLRLMVAGRPLANAAYRLVLDNGAELKRKTDHNGYLSEVVPAQVEMGTLFFETRWGRVKKKIKIGSLDPVDSLMGVQQRLRNLGYACVPTGGEDVATTAALSAFQSHTQGLSVTGQVDQATRDELVKQHGS